MVVIDKKNQKNLKIQWTEFKLTVDKNG